MNDEIFYDVDGNPISINANDELSNGKGEEPDEQQPAD